MGTMSAFGSVVMMQTFRPIREVHQRRSYCLNLQSAHILHKIQLFYRNWRLSFVLSRGYDTLTSRS